MSLEMAHKVIVPQKKIMSRSFLNSGTLIVKTVLTVYMRYGFKHFFTAYMELDKSVAAQIN
jgi:hypothetical protein